MKILVTNFHVLQWLRLCPPLKSINWSRKSGLYFFYFNHFYRPSQHCVDKYSLFYEQYLGGFRFLYACAKIVCFFIILYLIMFANTFRQKITEMFNSLSRIYNESKNREHSSKVNSNKLNLKHGKSFMHFSCSQNSITSGNEFYDFFFFQKKKSRRQNLWFI